jgi:hypothetical protein
MEVGEARVAQRAGHAAPAEVRTGHAAPGAAVSEPALTSTT